HEAGGKADGDAVAAPGLKATPGLEAENSRIAKHLAVKVGEQGRRGFVVTDVCARVDVAVADAGLQGAAPLPAGRPRTGPGDPGKRAAGGALRGNGAIAGQPSTEE